MNLSAHLHPPTPTHLHALLSSTTCFLPRDLVFSLGLCSASHFLTQVGMMRKQKNCCAIFRMLESACTAEVCLPPRLRCVSLSASPFLGPLFSFCSIVLVLSYQLRRLQPSSPQTSFCLEIQASTPHSVNRLNKVFIFPPIQWTL